MSAPDVNGSFRKAGIGALMLLTAAISPFTPANDAQAQQPQKVSAAQQSTIPYREIHHSSGILDEKSKEGIEMAAGVQSKDSHIVVLYGGDAQTWDMLMEKLQQAKNEGLPVKGVIVASPVNEISPSNGGKVNNQIQVWSGALNTMTINNPGPDSISRIPERLRTDYEKVILPQIAIRNAIKSGSPAPQ